MLRKLTYTTIVVLVLGITFFTALKVNFTREIIKSVYYFVYKETLKFKFSNCVENNLKKDLSSKIIIAGHTYGIANHTNNATYPKFLYALESEVSKKNKVKDLSKIILAGDIVKKANEKNFLEVKEKLKKFTNELIVAPGNHDFGPKILGDINNQNVFLRVFNLSFQSIDYKNNLFLILDTASVTGNITKEQIEFVKKEINKKNNWTNIFIITHHVVWSEMMTQKGYEIIPNLPEIKTNNFEDLLSIIKKINTKTNIYLFAGDIAVAPPHTKLFCEKESNIYYIATGMGNGRMDNYIRLEFSDDGNGLNIKPIFFSAIEE